MTLQVLDPFPFIEEALTPHTLTAGDTPIENPFCAEKFAAVMPADAGTTSPVKLEFVPLMF